MRDQSGTDARWWDEQLDLVEAPAGGGQDRRGWRIFLRDAADEHTRAVDTMPPHRIAPAIVLAALIGLFLELAVIRWQSACFHAFGHFKNVTLLSCFLGLGIGYALGKRSRIWTPLVLIGLAIQVIVLEALSRVAPDVELPAWVLNGLNLSESQGHLVGEGFQCALLLVTFVGNALMFIPLGQVASRLMGRMEKVRSYGFNLLGSLLGVALFSLCSWLWTPPTVWFAIAALGVIVLIAGSHRSLALAAPAVAALLIGFSLPDPIPQERYYSPYQLVSVSPQSSGVTKINVGHAYHQRVLDLGSELGRFSNDEMQLTLAEAKDYYDSLYDLVGPRDNVLIVGSGTGNDVAAALRGEAKHIDAVEIDPTILWLGKRLHPERPYQSARVTPILNDARSHFRSTGKKYDLIVYGLLDSHTMVGSHSNIRMDSYVYTVEAFREARNLLTDDGVLVMSFCLATDERGNKFYRMIEEAFSGGADGTSPRVFAHRYDLAKRYIVGPGMASLDLSTLGEEMTVRYTDNRLNASMSTDDWPFVYLNQREFPARYAVIVVAILILSAVMIRRTMGTIRSEGWATFFFLGAGFMLIETKGITDLGLVFGNTWVTVAVVICGILTMAYLANLWVQKLGQVNPRISFACLGVTFAVAYMALRAAHTGVLPIEKLILPAAITLPLFFAGLIFSSELARRGQIGSAMAANLFGAMCGGALEYTALWLGLTSLLWIGLALYACAFVASELAPYHLPRRITGTLLRPAKT